MVVMDDELVTSTVVDGAISDNEVGVVDIPVATLSTVEETDDIVFGTASEFDVVFVEPHAIDATPITTIPRVRPIRPRRLTSDFRPRLSLKALLMFHFLIDCAESSCRAHERRDNTRGCDG